MAIKKIIQKTKDHLDYVEETYFEHMIKSLGYGAKMIVGGLAAIIHAIIPAIFQTTASAMTAKLHQELQSRLAKIKAKCDDIQKKS